MKAGWKRVKLGEAISAIGDHRGRTPPKLTIGKYRVLSAKNIKTGKIVAEDSIGYFDDELYAKYVRMEIERGDIIITSEAPFGQVYYWNSDEKVALSQRLFSIRMNDGFEPRFVYYYLTTDRFQAELASRASGTTVMGLRQPELLKCEIICPPLPVQRRVAAVLGALDDKIELNRKMNANLEAQALFKSSVLALPANRGVPREAVLDACRKVRMIDTGSLVARNRTFTDYLQDGVESVYVEWGETKNGETAPEERTAIVQLVDYAHPDRNDFTVVNQWTVEGKAVKRPDVVLFVNGLPLVVIELKSPSREETDELDAYQQLQNYMQVITELFVYNAFLVTSDMSVTRAGTITSPESRFMQWKSVDGEYEDNEVAKFDTFFRGLLSPRRLIDVVKNFICFAADERGDRKILAKYKYPPEDIPEALETVISQCELWADNVRSL